MKKNKASNNPQILSPENYIRQKSRNLPVSKCYVNKDWNESQICQATIVREHASGNVSTCMYLVDLGCLGIKDTMYLFNVQWDAVDEILDEHKENGVDFMEVPYELVHNIIYAALEYAEDYGFKPHKDFTSVTSYFLEEDTDDIPLIPVVCGGEDGNPLYVNTGFDSPARVKQILAQLDKTAGEGNYHYILDVEGLDEEEDDDDYEDDDEEEVNEIEKEIMQLNPEERKKQFFELIRKGEQDSVQYTDDEVIRVLFLCQSIVYDIVTREAIDKQLNRFESIFEHEIVEEDELPNSLFADVKSMEGEIISDMFYDTMDKILDNKNHKKAIAQIRETAGDVAVADFLELFHLKKKESKKFKQKLEESVQKFPHYFLIKIYRNLSLSEGDWEEGIKRMEKLLSDEKQPITAYEAAFYFASYLIFLTQNQTIDLSVILAFEAYLHSLDSMLYDEFVEKYAVIHSVKMSMLIKHFIQTGELAEEGIFN